MFTVNDYVRALRANAHRFSPLQIQILRLQHAAPSYTITWQELAMGLGLSAAADGPINLQYGRLGRLIGEPLGYLPKRYGGTDKDWWEVISSGAAHGRPKRFCWTMHAALADALCIFGIVEDRADWLPEQVTTPGALPEGAVRTITINAYERNRAARDLCVAHYGAQCFICGFDFGHTYGDSLDGYIHVHHLLPLSEIGAEYEVDPISDLRPVCANCHAVIHFRSPPFTVDDVKRMLNEGAGAPVVSSG